LAAYDVVVDFVGGEGDGYHKNQIEQELQRRRLAALLTW
jgi:hypothetical protein